MLNRFGQNISGNLDKSSGVGIGILRELIISSGDI
jgi:hypothetical protein